MVKKLLPQTLFWTRNLNESADLELQRIALLKIRYWWKKTAHQYLIQPINIYFVLFYLFILRLEYGGNDVYRKNPKYFGKSHSTSYIEVKIPACVSCIPTLFQWEKSIPTPISIYPWHRDSTDKENWIFQRFISIRNARF